MKKKIVFLSLLFVLLITSFSWSYPDLYLPVMGGEKVRCDQGNNSVCNYEGDICTHRSTSNIRYAWDFNLLGTVGDDDVGLPQVAPASGEIVFAGDAGSGWGYCVVIEYEDGDTGVLGHCQEYFVKVGEFVIQGQTTCTIGTGFVPGRNYITWAGHIHNNTQRASNPNGPSIPSHFVDVALNDGNPLAYRGDYYDEDLGIYYYRSGNTFLFDRKFEELGGATYFGEMQADPSDTDNFTGIHWYYPFLDERDQNCYVREYDGNRNCNGRSMIVYDALHGAREPYGIICEFLRYWVEQGGPRSWLGMPISDEIEFVPGRVIIQPFQFGYLEWHWGDDNPLKVFEWPDRRGPGVLRDGGWSNEYSYLISMAFPRNGGIAGLGMPLGMPNGGVWSTGTYRVQNFRHPTTRKESIIMYDTINHTYRVDSGFLPPNVDPESIGGNKAFAIKNFFYDEYIRLDGYNVLGAPVSPEITINHLTIPFINFTITGITLQYFERGYLIEKEFLGMPADFDCFLYAGNNENCKQAARISASSFENWLVAHIQEDTSYVASTIPVEAEETHNASGSYFTLLRTDIGNKIQTTNPFRRISSTSVITVQDPYVYCWADFNVSRGIGVKWEWLSPDGEVISRAEGDYMNVNPPGYPVFSLLYNAFWHSYGEWTCKIYVDEGRGYREVVRRNFTIIPPYDLYAEGAYIGTEDPQGNSLPYGESACVTFYLRNIYTPMCFTYNWSDPSNNFYHSDHYPDRCPMPAPPYGSYVEWLKVWDCLPLNILRWGKWTVDTVIEDNRTIKSIRKYIDVPRQVDLRMVELDVNGQPHPVYTLGTDQPIHCKIWNSLDILMDVAHGAFLISRDNIPSEDDFVLSSFVLDGLGANDYKPFAGVINLPADWVLGSGEYFLIAHVYPVSTEEVRNNNTSFLPLTILEAPKTVSEDMMLVPEGSFLMGSCNEVSSPACSLGEQGYCGARYSWETNLQTVNIDYSYYIDEFEVTVLEYTQCVEAGGCSFANVLTAESSIYCNYGDPSKADHPMNCVNFFGALEYCQWALKDLPTEAEWEKAARGTDGRQYPWGNESPTCDLVNYASCVGNTMPVGSYPLGVSPYGVHDMAGNAKEWTKDDSGDAYKLIKGGSHENNHHQIRPGFFEEGNPAEYGGIITFRCVLRP